MPLDTSISDLWWLKTEPPRSSVPALALGAQIAQHRADSIIQAEALKTRTAMGMVNLMLERERNNIALQSFRAKQTTDLLRQRGMAEIGDYMANAVAREKLTDPETQAGFFRLTSKYAPFVPETVFNSMWDNTFKPAMDRDARAKGKAGDSTITERDFNQWRQLKEIAKAAPEGLEREDAEEELRIFERMKNIGDVATGPPQRDVDFGITKVGESEQIWLRNPKTGVVTFKSMPKTGITASEQQKIEYASKVHALEEMAKSRMLRKPDGTRPSRDEYQDEYNRQLDKLNEEFQLKASTPAAPVGTGTNAPADPLGLFR